MEQVKRTTSQLEDLIAGIAAPIKPYIPIIARFLLVVTFLEDSIRIIFQWSDQLRYLEKYRGFYWGFSHFFLAFNVLTMFIGSFMAITKKHTQYAVIGLFCVIVSQTLGYGLLFDFKFFLRNLSLIGGLLMLLADVLHKRQTVFAGLPSVSEIDKSTYFQLAGRILLIFLFMSFVFAGEMTPLRIFSSIVGFIACIMVVVGFKAKWSALFLVLFLSIFNVIINNWWSIHHAHPSRDFVKYDFFQTLSVMGGLMLLVSMGPGGLSVDEKKKMI
ncbi:SURF4-domain-containing protein [Basidiobolus meristosporus CBS 931.73]|uniref:SURF4-domain-containing protein n=1 Tax=Basidiobolus meristosporus CBS 931.73 TaxID=1314790 RepID=A0A1Y1WYJ2_9FUNG|nr:SURF4-domain-containing protein [Basidiobolus meristosporus CBS 931.73]|eukprot:ORX78649.1 SURF4-domain-containing protein [Basidiobolus meristosporus CBS 931.73]